MTNETEQSLKRRKQRERLKAWKRMTAAIERFSEALRALGRAIPQPRPKPEE